MSLDRPAPLLRSVVLHGVLIVLATTMLLPFLWMVATSLKSESEVFQRHLLPESSTMGADGAILRTTSRATIFSALPGPDDGTPAQADLAGTQAFHRGGPLRISIGSPDVQQGVKGDRARTTAGGVPQRR